MTATNRISVIVLSALVLIVTALPLGAVEIEPTALSNEMTALRYGLAFNAVGAQDGDVWGNPGEDVSAEFNRGRVRNNKSPFKAFLLSAAVPGLGQWYYGSRVKPFLFLGTEIAVWSLHIKWHGEGEDATDVYEAFNRKYWSRDRYEQQYLLWVYGETDDELIDAQEVSHHLPDTETQQFFEMTGKYNQFSWGWADAHLSNGRELDDFGLDDPPPAITADAESQPISALRLEYEGLRHDANTKYDRASKMVAVSIFNRLVSAFEAYFVTRNHNRKASSRAGVISRIGIWADVESVYEAADTPVVTLAYRF